MPDSAGNYGYLIQKIDDFIRRYYLNKILRGSIYLAAALFSAYIVITLTEYFGNFGPGVRTSLFYGFILLNLALLARYIVIPGLAYFRLGKMIDHEQASQIIGEHFGHIRDKLLNTLQLKKLSDENAAQRQLILAGIEQKAQELKPVPFASAVKLGHNKRYLKYALAPLGVIVLIALTAPSMLSESTLRLMNHNTVFVKKAPFNFVILNKDLSVIQGQDIELQVKLTGNELPAELYLQDGKNTYKLEKQNIANFRYTLRNLQQDKEIYLTGGEFSSVPYVIRVKRKPSLLNIDAELRYPAYLGRRNETLQNTGDLTVPAGTQVTWRLKAENATAVEFSLNGQKVLLQPSGESFSVSRRVVQTGSYSLNPVNQEVNTPDASNYRLQVIPDLSPMIDVNEKPDSVNSKLLYFVGQVSDDYGFSNLSFHYRIRKGTQEGKVLSVPVSFDRNALQSNFFYAWNHATIGAKGGEEVEYYFEIRDNDGVSGPKVTRSAVRTLKVPTQSEAERKIDEASEALKKKMEEAMQKAGEVERDAKKLNQEMKGKKSLSFDDKKQIEELLKKQKELEDLVKDIKNENKQNQFDRNQMDEQSQEILDKQKQIEDLFNNVLDEKTKEILRNIQELLEQNNKNMTQEELAKMQMDNKSLQKELDRMLELYKQLEFDQKLDNVTEKLKELAEEQKKLSQESAQKQGDKSALDEKQEELNKEFDQVQKDLQDLEKKNNELDKKTNYQNPEDQQQKIDQQQQESSKNLEKKDFQKAAQNQKQAAEQMQQMAEQLEQQQQQGEQQEAATNASELREILDNLLTSSFDQERLMQGLKGTNPNDPSYVQLTQKQKDIQDNLKMVQDSLFSLSKRVPQIESVVNKEIDLINFNVSKALENLAERRTAEANRNQQYAMTSINNLALMLNEALNQLQKMQQNASQGGKSGQQSLSQLRKMQEQLNKNMQQARQQMQQQGIQPGQKMGKGQMSEQMAKMAREQQMIRQRLQEINQQNNKDGSQGLGNLNDLAKKMEQSETELVNKRIAQETLNRQQEILTKLLEAEKAERERDEEQRREAKTGIELAPNYNSILQEYQKIKQRETELLRTVPPSLNSFYKNKVGDYFKFLNSGTKND